MGLNFERLASSEDRDAWLEARRSGITATDISRLAHSGATGWANLRAEKAGDRGPIGSNAYMRWGSEREKVIAADIMAVIPGLVHNTDLLRSVEDPRWLATPDMLSDTAVADIKTAVYRGGPWTEPPPSYRDQVLWQMHVTGAEVGYLGVEYHSDFVPVSQEPDVLTIERDEKRIAELVDIAEQFLAGEQPSIWDTRLEDYRVKKALRDAAQADLDEVTKLIRKELDGMDSFKTVRPAGSISLSTPKPKRVFATARFRDEHPDLYEEYTSEGAAPKPRLTVTINEEDM